MRFLLPLFLMILFLDAKKFDLSFQKMKQNSYKIVLKKVLLSNNTNSYPSKHFTIYWGGDNPATTLWGDYNKDNIPDFITNTSSILENVWETEITKFGFKTPHFNHIPVYISDTGLFFNGEPLTLAKNIYGYSEYNGEDEYIVINAVLPLTYKVPPLNSLKVTLAHEFFHLIQYNYAIQFNKNNLWLYEGTAVLMEHLVYPKIKDYLYSYVKYFFEETDKGFVNSEDIYPYSSVLFFDYLKNRYGLKIIKKIWENFETFSEKNSLKVIDYTLQTDYNSSLKKETFTFYKSLDINLSVFSNSDTLTQFNLMDKKIICNGNLENIEIYPFGAYFTNNCPNISFENSDLNFTFSYKNNSSFQINKKFSVLFPNELNITKLYSNTIKLKGVKNEQFSVKKGWNLINFKIDKNCSQLVKNYPFEIIWEYNNTKWAGCAKNIEFQKILKKNGIQFENINYKNGVWIYSNKNIELNQTQFYKGFIDYNLTKGWNLVSNLSLIDLNLSLLFKKDKKLKFAFSWNEEKQEWNLFSNNNEILKLNSFPIKENINYKGVWIWKEK